MKMAITQLGNPILRQKAKEVTSIKNYSTQRLIDKLLTTVIKVNGVGLAAPQLNKPWRIFILASHPNPRYPKAPQMKPRAIINPQILATSGKKIKDWEGCLSIPGIRGLVPRYEAVRVEYTDRMGKHIKARYKNFIARIFQHEYDHLEGIVFLDRLQTTKEIITEQEYQKMVNQVDRLKIPGRTAAC
jgi:peptide deformylase